MLIVFLEWSSGSNFRTQLKNTGLQKTKNHCTTKSATVYCIYGFTATLRDDLHWLPIRPRITYKLCTIVYKCLHGAAPSYLTEMCVPVAASTGRRCLRSAARGDLMVSRTRTITYGSRSFAVSGPRVWNDLPAATDFAFIIRHTWTVPKQTKDNTISLGLRDMTWRFRDCLGR